MRSGLRFLIEIAGFSALPLLFRRCSRFLWLRYANLSIAFFGGEILHRSERSGDISHGAGKDTRLNTTGSGSESRLRYHARMLDSSQMSAHTQKLMRPTFMGGLVP